MRLLAINFGGIGDEILFLPTLKSIRTAYPDWNISLLLEPRSRSVAEITDLADSTLEFDIKKRPLFISDLLDLTNMLREGRFDIVISSGSSPLVSLLLFSCAIPRRIGYKTSILADLLLTDPVPLNKDQYAACMYHDLVKGLGISDAPRPPQITARPDALVRMQKFLSSRLSGTAGATRIVLLHPGTSKLAVQKGIRKAWSPDHWAQTILKLAGQVDTAVVLAGGPDDEETVSDILKLVEDRAGDNFISAHGATRSLSDLVALIDLSDLMICVDSAPMHVAAGLNKKLVALFGPTDPSHLLPVSDRFIAIRAESINQQGVQIHPEQVLQAASELLQSSPDPDNLRVSNQ